MIFCYHLFFLLSIIQKGLNFKVNVTGIPSDSRPKIFLSYDFLEDSLQFLSQSLEISTFLIELDPNFEHVITKEWIIPQGFSINLTSYSPNDIANNFSSLSTILFKYSLTSIFTKGSLSLTRIELKMQESSNIAHLHAEGEYASLSLELTKLTSVLTTVTGNSRGNFAFIYIQNSANLTIVDFIMEGFSYSGGILLGTDAGSVLISNITILSMTFFGEFIFFFSNLKYPLRAKILVLCNCRLPNNRLIYISRTQIQEYSHVLIKDSLFFGAVPVSELREVKFLNGINQVILINNSMKDTVKMFSWAGEFENGFKILKIFSRGNKLDIGTLFRISLEGYHLLSIEEFYICKSEFVAAVDITTINVETNFYGLIFINNNNYHLGEVFGLGLKTYLISNNSVMGNMIFIGNKAKNLQAGIYFINSKNNFALENFIFIDNNTTLFDLTSGLCIHFFTQYPIKANLKLSIFDSNNLNGEFRGGPALIFDSAGGYLSIDSSVFRNNRAAKYSNAIEFEGDEISIINTEFSDHTSIQSFLFIQSSTGLLFAQANRVFLSNSLLLRNSGYSGNFFLCEKENLVVTVYNVQFLQNYAILGDFIYVYNINRRTNISILNTVFKYNYNFYYGLGIYGYFPYKIDYINVKVENCLFENNFLDDDGIFSIWVYWGESTVKFTNCTFGLLTVINTSPHSPLISFLSIKNRIQGEINTCVFKNLFDNFPRSVGIFSIFNSFIVIKNTLIENLGTYLVFGLFILDENADMKIENCFISNFSSYIAGFGGTRLSSLSIINTVIQGGAAILSLIEIRYNSYFEMLNSTIYNCFVKSGEVIRVHESESKILSTSFTSNYGISITIEASSLMFFECRTTFFYKTFFKSFSKSSINISASQFFQGSTAIMSQYSNDALVMTSDNALAIFSGVEFVGVRLKSPSRLFYFLGNETFIFNTIFYNIICEDSTQVMMSHYIEVSLAINFNLDNVSFNAFNMGILNALQSNISINNLRVLQNQGSLLQSVLYVVDCFDVKINASHFQGVASSVLQGGCLKIINTNSFGAQYTKTNISNNKFYNNSISKTGHGACLYVEERPVSIISNVFINNSAGFGGALYLNFKSLKALIFLENNNFSFNSAKKAGGAIFWAIIKPNISNSNTFLLNEANTYGNDIASNPLRMLMEIDGKTSPNHFLTLNHARPGELLNSTILITLLDAYFHEIPFNYEDKTVVIKLSLNDTYNNKFNLFGKLFVESDKNEKNYKFNFSNVALDAPINSNITLIFICDELNELTEEIFRLSSNLFQNEQFSQDGTYQLELQVSVGNCETGEMFTTGKCAQCPKGTFSFNKNDVSCRPCPSYAFCEGGKTVRLKPGFWRRNPLSEHIYYCNKALQSCKGGIDNLCSDFYTGTKCEKCIESDPYINYQKSLAGMCLPCPNLVFLVFLLILTITLASLLLIYLLYLLEKADGDDRKKICLKMIINYFQFFMILQSYESSIPNALRDYIYFSGYLARITSLWFSMECIIKSLSSSYDFQIEVLTFCVLCNSISVTSYLLSIIPSIRKKFQNKGVQIEFRNIFIFSMYIFVPSLVDYLISSFYCEEIDDNLVLRKYPDYICYTREHLIWLILLYLPMLFSLIIGPPFIYQYYNKKRHNFTMKFVPKRAWMGTQSKFDILQLGFLENKGFLPEVYCFALKIVLISINHSPISSNVKHPILLFILIASIIICDPFLYKLRVPIYHFLDFSSKISITSISYLLLWVTDDIDGTQTSAKSKIIFGVMIIAQILHFLFLITIMFQQKLSKYRVFHYFVRECFIKKSVVYKVNRFKEEDIN